MAAHWPPPRGGRRSSLDTTIGVWRPRTPIVPTGVSQGRRTPTATSSSRYPLEHLARSHGRRPSTAHGRPSTSQGRPSTSHARPSTANGHRSRSRALRADDTPKKDKAERCAVVANEATGAGESLVAHSLRARKRFTLPVEEIPKPGRVDERWNALLASETLAEALLEAKALEDETRVDFSPVEPPTDVPTFPWDERVPERQWVPMVELKAAGFELEQGRDVGLIRSAFEARLSGYSAVEARRVGFLRTTAQLRRAGYSADEARAAGVSAHEARAAGLIETCEECARVGWGASEAREADFRADDVLRAGLIATAAEGLAAGFTCGELKDVKLIENGHDAREAGFTVQEARAAGLIKSLADLKKAGFGGKEAKQLLYSLEECLCENVIFFASDAREAGYNQRDAKRFFTEEQMAEAGYDTPNQNLSIAALSKKFAHAQPDPH